MAQHTLTTDTVLDLLHEVSDHIEEVRPDYSGRGMYGDHCLGIVSENPARLLIAVGEWVGRNADDIDHDLAWRIGQPRQDSMGLSSIVYWEGLTLDEDAAAAVDAEWGGDDEW